MQASTYSEARYPDPKNDFLYLDVSLVYTSKKGQQKFFVEILKGFLHFYSAACILEIHSVDHCVSTGCPIVCVCLCMHEKIDNLTPGQWVSSD